MGIFLPGEKLTADRLNERTIDVIGGHLRVTSAAGIAGTETVWATVSNLPVRANTVYTIELDGVWFNTVDGEQFVWRVRDTNLAGAVLAPAIDKGFGGGEYTSRCKYTFTTSSAGTRTFVATFQRIVSVSGGSGTVGIGSRVRMLRDGDSGLYTTS